MMNNRIALVTGASSGIGEAICKAMIDENITVYGVGRNFSNTDSKLISSQLFHKIEFDFNNINSLEECLKMIPVKDISILINNAGSAYYGLHQDISERAITEMINVDLTVPMLLTRHFIKPLQEHKGIIINIASVAGLQSSPHGAAYGAIKAGLIHFSESIFAENRKHGVKVTTILPDMTDTNLYRNADFTCSLEEGCYLNPQDVANAVMYAVNLREGMTVTNMVLKPQYHRIQRKTSSHLI